MGGNAGNLLAKEDILLNMGLGGDSLLNGSGPGRYGISQPGLVIALSIQSSSLLLMHNFLDAKHS